MINKKQLLINLFSKIREIRIQKKISEESFCLLTKISPSELLKFESGETEPSYLLLVNIIRVLDLSKQEADFILKTNF